MTDTTVLASDPNPLIDGARGNGIDLGNQNLPIETSFVGSLCVLPPPVGCRITAGGYINGFTDPNSPATIFKATFGGQVGAPCGCSGCFDAAAGRVQGNWTHSRKSKNGRFKADMFNSLICGCNTNGEARFDGNLCTPGPPPRTPANTICVSGVGTLDESGGPKGGRPVAFRFQSDDRGEPGVNDHYRIRMWAPSGTKTPAQLAREICCTIADPTVTDPLLVDDDGDLIGGNIQIHPALAKSDPETGNCPPPRGSCQ